MSKMMKAALLHRIGDGLRIDRVHVPKIGTNDVLVDVKAAGVCHSDINYRDGVSRVGKLPIILGHEIAGIVAKVGNHVEGLERGDKVCVHYVISCGKCGFCRDGRENLCEEYQMIGKDVDGGFAEYVKVPARNVLKLKSVSFEEGAIIGCAVSTAFHALKRARVVGGETVVVYGVGGVGLHAVQLAAKIFKAGNIIAVDISKGKLKLAEKLGAKEVVNAVEEDPVERVHAVTDGRLADIALDFVGLRETIEKAIYCVGKGGKMVMVGIGIEKITVSPYKILIGKEMDFIGVNDHLKVETAQLIEFVDSGRINLSDSITHRISLDDLNNGIDIVKKRIGEPIRVVVVQ